MGDITRIFEICGSNLVALTMPYPNHTQLEILATVFRLTPRLRNLTIAVGPVLWVVGSSERLQARNHSTQNQPTVFETWSSKSLRSVRFEFRERPPLPTSINLAFDSFMRPDAFPNLRKILKVQRNGKGNYLLYGENCELQVTNMKNQKQVNLIRK